MNRAGIVRATARQPRANLFVLAALAGLLDGDPGAAFRGNFTQREKMAEIRSDSRAIPGPATFRAQPDVASAGCPGRYRFCDHRSGCRSLARVQHQLREKAEQIPGFVDVYATLRNRQSRTVGFRSIENERPRWASKCARLPIRCESPSAVMIASRVTSIATAGDAYDVELRLVGIDRNDVPSISQLYVRTNPTLSTVNDVAVPDTRSNNGANSLTRIDNVVRL